MATLKLPPIFSTRYTPHRVIRRQYIPPKTFWQRFIHTITSYPTKVWISYYAFFIVGTTISAITIQKTGIATTVMDWVRLQQRLESQARRVNRSNFRITTSPGLVALVNFPGGDRAGDTAEGIRFTDASNVTFNRSDAEAWYIHTATPKEGDYYLDFTCRKSGNHRFTIQTMDRQGVRLASANIDFTCQTDRRYRYLYHLDFNQPDTITVTYQSSS